MTLIYLDAISKDNALVQFSFRADHQEILFKSEQIIKAFDKRYNPDYVAGELTYVKGSVKEIKTQLISKDGKFRF